MSNDAGTLDSVAEQLALALQPLGTAVADLPSFQAFMNRLGWDAQALTSEWSALATKVGDVVTALNALRAARSVAAALALLEKIAAVYRALQAITTAPPGVADPGAFLADIARRVFELLLVEYLTEARPTVAALLRAAGVITETPHAEEPDRPLYVETRFHFEELGRNVSDPGSIPGRVYGWGTDDLDFELLATHLHELALVVGLDVRLGRADPVLAAGLQAPADQTARGIATQLTFVLAELTILGEPVEVALAALELPPESGHPAGVIVQPLIPPGVAEEQTIAPDWKLQFRAGSDLARTFGILVWPDGVDVRYPFEPGTPPPKAGFGLALDHTAEAPFRIFGEPQGVRLELKGVTTSFNLDFHGGELDLRVEASPEDLKLIVSAADLDGFLGELLGRGDRTIPITLAVQWSNRTGFNFTGGAGLEVSTHPHLSLGPIRVERVDLAIKSTFDSGHPPDLKLQVRTVLAGAIGPVTFSADGLGVTLSLVFADGNAGPFDIEYGFTPPTGLGIAVDAGPIAGGGFLSFEKDKARYAGALELSVFEYSVKAIGFVETELPNGAPGYSFVILISAQFTPIQLGLGFTLDGVGGLIAINRRLDVEALRARMLTGSVDDVLYPSDPIGDAPRIISELAVLFPPAPNHFVFAPTALISWATIVRAELAVVFEPPSPLRVTLLGLISSTLPTEDTAIVTLHVAVLGKIDIARLRVAIDAKLYDSNVAGFPLTGDMAARVVWGFPPTVVIALGGLNPHFAPPPDFPKLDRLTIVLGSGDNPKLTCQAYLAMTPNTLQFGVYAELYAAAAGFNIRGWVNFDCLIQRFPFAFRADMAGDVAFRRGEHVLASVHVEASLTGPVPWHLWGKASLSLWLFDVTVPFNITFGLRLPLPMPVSNPWSLLQAAIEDIRSWSTELPTAAFRAVTLRTVPSAVDPGGAAILRQTVVPLNRKITRFRAAKLEGPDRYRVTLVRINNSLQAEANPVTEYFAAAEFDDLTDTEKLSRPSFEHMDAGISVGAGVILTGSSIGAKLEYETIILDAPWQRRSGPPYSLAQDLQLLMLENGASVRAPLKSTGLKKFAAATPPKLSMDDDRFAIASTLDGTAIPGLTAATTKGVALAALADHLKGHPKDRGRLQVVPEYELVGTP